MDVVGFVGFAGSGPLNVPVVVEGYADFAAIFGGPIRLAWDPSAGRYAEAQLGPAIQAFFAGGGRRAYVVRVAGPRAERARHPVPGLIRAADGKLANAELVARAYGSWSDALGVGAALTSEPAVVTHFALDDDGPVLGLRGRALVEVADLLRVRAGSWTGYLPVRSVAASASGSPIGGIEQLVQVDRQHALWLEPSRSPGGRLDVPNSVWARLRPGDSVERLGLELWVRGRLGENWVLTGLGFVPQHPRYLGHLPTDEDLFGPRDLATELPELWDAVGSPRFPLAAGHPEAIYYPVAVDVVPETYSAAVTSDRPALTRDGLESYDDDLFLDPGLRDVGLQTVIATADYLRWQAPRPRQLFGIHALLGVEEVTVIAAPDATQRPWRVELPGQAPEPPPSPPDPTVPEGCRRPPFADCVPFDPPPAPTLSASFGPGNVVQLCWTLIAEPAAVYRLQVTTDPRGWDTARDVYLGTDLSRSFHGGGFEHRFYRVRAEFGTLHTSWSNGVAAVADPHPGLRHVVASPSEYVADRLLAVHRCLLRMCAARGDLLAVLSLPEHYRAADAITHAEQLRSGVDFASPVPPLGSAEERALGFGAVYHPWVGSRPSGPVAS